MSSAAVLQYFSGNSSFLGYQVPSHCVVDECVAQKKSNAPLGQQ